MLICDHASNWLPAGLDGLGLPDGELARHIAWDPGALDTAFELAHLLDAVLVHATVSRLVLDVNRDPEHPGSIVSASEDTLIPGNQSLELSERSRRVTDIYEPYHQAVAEVIAERPDPRVVAIHSFTPVYRGQHRPWHIGVLSARDRRMADPLLAGLRSDPALVVGDNQPYAPADGIYHTLARHCEPRALRSVMLELRADLVSTARSQQIWARRLASTLRGIH